MVDHQHVSSIPKSIRAGLSRRQLLRGAAPGTAVGLGVSSKLLAQDGEDELHGREHARAFNARPIPVGVGPFAPFGIFIHHMPVTPGFPLMDINEPSNITDFNGFVGITRIRGGGTGIDTLTGATTDLAFQADMGFNQGHFIGAGGLLHEGTFGFV